MKELMKIKQRGDKIRSLRFKVISIFTLSVFFLACVTKTTYFSPYETEKIVTAKKIIITLYNGQELELKGAQVIEEELIGYSPDGSKKNIKIEEIQSVREESTSIGYLVVFAGVAAVAAWLIVGGQTAPAPPPPTCCPFVYSFNGQDFVFDAEPYGGAISQGLKRVEWSKLDHLQETSGNYRLLLANQLEETQYTDEIKLVVVDHPPEVKIGPGPFGEIHTMKSPIPPSLAINREGTDILEYVHAQDEILWERSMSDIDPDSPGDFGEELIFEFPKPPEAKRVKLLVNAQTSLWGTRMGKIFLNQFGTSLDEWHAEIDSKGPAYYRFMAWYLKQELYHLQIRVETEMGWQSRGAIVGGAPFSPKDRIYMLDIADVSGETLRIKLTPPLNFWKIDHLAVDYSEDVVVTAHELKCTKATNFQNIDVLSCLDRTDNTYLEMSTNGDAVELLFPAPPQPSEYERTVILKISGYYRIHFAEPMGPPRLDVVERAYTDPSFTGQFALLEYNKWKAKYGDR